MAFYHTEKNLILYGKAGEAAARGYHAKARKLNLYGKAVRAAGQIYHTKARK